MARFPISPARHKLPPSRSGGKGMKGKIAAVLSLAALLGGCGQSNNTPPPDGVLIRIDSVVADQFQQGRAGACAVTGQVLNTSKYRVDNIAFQIGGVQLQTGTVRAKDHTDEIVLGSPERAEGSDTPPDCVDAARRIAAAAGTKPKLDCTMAPNVPEGDCQDLTVVTVALDDKAVRKLQSIVDDRAALERHARSLQAMPVSQALDRIVSERNDDMLVDFLIRPHATHWFMNRYDEGSAHVTSRHTEAGSGDTLLHADFVYIGRAKGWVTVR